MKLCWTDVREIFRSVLICPNLRSYSALIQRKFARTRSSLAPDTVGEFAVVS